jgi:LmbE family N-acetylglucosaminyl deacetylase
VTVLIVVAHPDDEVLAAGGTARVWADRGIDVVPCILSSRAEARQLRPDSEDLRADMLEACAAVGMREPIEGAFPNIRMNTVPHLELVQFIEGAIRQVAPRVIITHHPGDVNDDHRQTSAACQAASRLYQRGESGASHLEALLYAEVLSSTDWAYPSNTIPFIPSAYVAIGEHGLAAKMRALKAYRDVMRPYPHPRSPEALRGLATVRGASAGMDLAEAFQAAYVDITTCAAGDP